MTSANLCRPLKRTRCRRRIYPALKRWAQICCPCGTDVCGRPRFSRFVEDLNCTGIAGCSANRNNFFATPGFGSCFPPRLGLSSLSNGRTMMQQNNNAATSTAVCLWCNSQFLKGTSRAQDGRDFCSKKCETRAQFWFHTHLRIVSE